MTTLFGASSQEKLEENRTDQLLQKLEEQLSKRDGVSEITVSRMVLALVPSAQQPHSDAQSRRYLELLRWAVIAKKVSISTCWKLSQALPDTWYSVRDEWCPDLVDLLNEGDAVRQMLQTDTALLKRVLKEADYQTIVNVADTWFWRFNRWTMETILLELATRCKTDDELYDLGRLLRPRDYQGRIVTRIGPTDTGGEKFGVKLLRHSHTEQRHRISLELHKVGLLDEKHDDNAMQLC
jgi:signal transduction histidine kinase